MTNANAHYSGGLAVAAYDLFTGGGLLAGDIGFYLDCARRFGDPVLEIGTGTGRISVPLAIAGNEVVGLDISPAMLERAAAKLADSPEVRARLQLVEGDMTNFDLNRQFPLVMNTARSFQHLLTPSQQRAALQCAHRHLKPGGHLVLDLFDPYFELLFANASTPAAPREVLDVSSGRKIRRTLVSRHNDPMTQ